MFRFPSKIWLPAGGGLGDIVRCYLRDEPHWGYLKTLHEQQPDIKIKVVSTSHNPEVPALFKHTPFIDEVKELGWMMDGRTVAASEAHGYTPISSIISHLQNLRHFPPEFYLDEEDKKIYDSIVSKGRYIFVHPFAIRAALPLEEFIPMFDRLIDEHGFNIVVIGASHTRTARKGAIGPHDPGGKLFVKEELTYERPGLFNLANKCNVRTAMQLCATADRFLGHCSCYNIVAWIKGIKSFIFSPPDQKLFLATSRTHAWPLIDRLPWCKNVFSDEWTSPRDAANQAIQFLGE